jgi:YD repeat-containing protein
MRTFGYDINDNLTTEAWDNGTNLTYTYDKVGNLKTSVDGSSNTTDTYTYDAISVDRKETKKGVESG